MALLAGGASNAKIAATLFVTANTVRTHLDRIRDKTGARNRAELTRYAIQTGIEPDVHVGRPARTLCALVGRAAPAAARAGPYVRLMKIRFTKAPTFTKAIIATAVFGIVYLASTSNLPSCSDTIAALNSGGVHRTPELPAHGFRLAGADLPGRRRGFARAQAQGHHPRVGGVGTAAGAPRTGSVTRHRRRGLGGLLASAPRAAPALSRETGSARAAAPHGVRVTGESGYRSPTRRGAEKSH